MEERRKSTTGATSSDKRVLTLVMLGTGKHHESDYTILNSIVDAVAEGPDQTTHLIDGVGGKPKDKNSQHPMVGTYDFQVESFDPDTGKLEFKKTKKKFLSKLKGESSTKAGGAAIGSGYRDAMAEALKVVEAMVNGDRDILSGKKTLVINMAGFSRGADTLIRVSNLLATRYPDLKIEINILALDPVPGAGREKAKKASLIPSIVKQFVVVSMKNETRPGFAPQDLTRLTIQTPETTRVKQLLLPGVHRQAIRFLTNPKKAISDRYSDSENTQHAAHLLWHQAHEFFRLNGTRLSKPIDYVWQDKKGVDHIESNPFHGEESASANSGGVPGFPGENTHAQRLTWYNESLSRQDLYEAIALKRVKGIHFKSRDIANPEHLSNYFLHGTQFFHDSEHMMLFKSVYPAFFDFYFQKNLEGHQFEDVSAEVEKIASREPDAARILLPLVGWPPTPNPAIALLQEIHPDLYNYVYGDSDTADRIKVLASLDEIAKDARFSQLQALSELKNARKQGLPPPRVEVIDHLKNNFPEIYHYYFENNKNNYSYAEIYKQLSRINPTDSFATDIFYLIGIPSNLSDPHQAQGISLPAESFYLNQALQIAYHRYPQFFDYFYRNNSQNNDTGIIIEQIEKIRQDKDVAQLLTALPDLQHVETEEALPPPRYLAGLTDLDRYKDLLQLYEAVRFLCHQVMTQRDSSEKDPDVARQLLAKINETLGGQSSPQDKIASICETVKEFTDTNNSLFSAKLAASIAHHSEYQPTNNFLIRHVIAALADVEKKYGLSGDQMNLLNLTRTNLVNIFLDKQRDQKYDSIKIAVILKQALEENGKYTHSTRKSKTKKLESKFDKILRECLLQTHVPYTDTQRASANIELWKETRRASTDAALTEMGITHQTAKESSSRKLTSVFKGLRGSFKKP